MKAVICFSGGLDSTTLLYQTIAIHGKGEVAAISFDYKQRHSIELEYAGKLTKKLQIPHTIIELRSEDPDGRRDPTLSILKGSSQSDPTVKVPEGHYADPSMRQTFVPNRNMIMLSMAAAYALSLEAEYVYFAAHAGDHAIYPDCRQPFVDAMNTTLGVANYSPITIRAPFVNISKAQIVILAEALQVPFAETWSCYRGEAQPCGRCGTCVERILAFDEANVEDPTYYLAGPEYARSQKAKA